MAENFYRTRIAPTTSGLLHIGHAQTFLCACNRARSFGGKVVLRIDDIDFERCSREYEQAAIADMKSAGIFWDEGPDIGGEFGPYRQSGRLGIYESVLRELIGKGCVYPSPHSRAEIVRATRPCARKFDFCESEPIFPESFRPKSSATNGKIENFKNLNWRFKVEYGRKIEFCDGRFGEVEFTGGEDFGDFLVWRKCGAPSYELASAIDDSQMCITEIVRGEDLLLSTARQILLWNALSAQIPAFYHCPLLRGDFGEKLSKTSMRKSGLSKWLIRANKARE